MSVRSFDWRDLPVLHRYRNQGLVLDSALLLTRGATLMPTGALLTYLAPATGIFTYLSDDGGQQPLVGQVVHTAGSPTARMIFLAPEAALETADPATLFEHITFEMGERGAFHILAEVNEQHPAFVALHKTGFAIYARQRIWWLEGEASDLPPVGWRPAVDRDLPAIRSLYANLAPGLVQQAEPLIATHPRGMVYYDREDLHAYIELKIGPRGIFAQPFIHPDAEDLTNRLPTLLRILPERRSRPLYVCVRSYQSWLESALEAGGAQPGLRQAVMVKRLAIARRVELPYAIRSLDGTRPEPTAPVSVTDGGNTTSRKNI
jgi:hypothetical protein